MQKDSVSLRSEFVEETKKRWESRLSPKRDYMESKAKTGKKQERY